MNGEQRQASMTKYVTWDEPRPARHGIANVTVSCTVADAIAMQEYGAYTVAARRGETATHKKGACMYSTPAEALADFIPPSVGERCRST